MPKKPATPKKPVPKKAPAKKPLPKKGADEMPRFMNRFIGKTEIVKLYRNDKGKLIKVDGKGVEYDAETDKKMPKK